MSMTPENFRFQIVSTYFELEINDALEYKKGQ